MEHFSNHRHWFAMTSENRRQYRDLGTAVRMSPVEAVLAIALAIVKRRQTLLRSIKSYADGTKRGPRQSPTKWVWWGKEELRSD